MSSDTEFEWTDATTSREAAALLRDLADGVEAGEVAFDDGEATRVGTVPEDVTVELEFESVDGESELEVELWWGGTGHDAEPADGDDEPEDEDGEETAGDGDDGAADYEDGSLPAVLSDAEGPSGSLATFEVYRDRADEWRWRLVHDNGNIIADSGEGYARRGTAVNGLRSVQHNAPGADVDVEE